MEVTNYVYTQRDRALAIGTHSSYRSTLSRQILTLRRRLGRATPRNAKFSNTKRKEITGSDISANREFAYLLLLQCERAWAHALAMKHAHAEDPSPKSSTKRHITSRLHRAVSYAQELVILVQEANLPQQEILEVDAYAASMNGTEAFERAAGKKGEKRWKKCLTHFSEAHVIYSTLWQKTQKEVFREMLAGEVDQSIRVAAYQSSLPRTITTSAIAKRYFPDDSRSKTLIEKIDPSAFSTEEAATGEATEERIPTVMQWRGRTAKISDAAIGQAVAATISAAEQLSSYMTPSSTNTSRHPGRAKAAAAYDGVLNSAQETVDCVRTAISELTKEGVAESDSRMQDLRICDLAANFELISWRVGRNRVLISSAAPSGSATTYDDGRTSATAVSISTHNNKTRPAKRESRSHALNRLKERIVLYDAITQSLDSLEALPGASRDATFLEDLATRKAYFNSLRALNIAFSHILLRNHREALALFNRAAAHLHNATSAVGSVEEVSKENGQVPTLFISATQFDLLKQTVSTHLRCQHGLVALHALSPSSPRLITEAGQQGAAGTVLADHLEKWHTVIDKAHLVTYPPRLRAVPVKPIFLDLAWNYLTYPGTSASSTSSAAAAAAAAAVSPVSSSNKSTVKDTKTVQVGEKEKQEAPKKRGWFGF